MTFFSVGHFEFLFQEKKFFCFIPMKISQSFMGSKDGSILMIALVSSQKLPTPNIFGSSVCIVQGNIPIEKDSKKNKSTKEDPR